MAEEAATAALVSDGRWVREKVADVIANRERFRAALVNMGLAPLGSDANFVLVAVPDASAISTRMRTKGVAVRPFARLPHIGDALRISIGPWFMMSEALQALEESLR
jgi:histidinol-phosphate/aromatic aminotransferase/cobyric acid decarboxylase-like protein